MNKYIGKLFLGALTVASLTACSSDFLDTTPTQSTATATVFSTTENVKLAVNGLAYLMKSQHAAFTQGYCGENAIRSIFSEYLSQEFRYNQFATGWEIIMDGKYYTAKTTKYAKYPWAYYYEIISNANSIIAHVDEATGEESDKLFYKAQALTFRAYCYSKLMEIYTPRWQDTNNGETKGIVLRLDESTGSMPLSTVKECWDQIYQDCKDAIADFEQSGEDRASKERYLTNKNVAYAIYARAALYRQDYQTALEMAKKAREGYALMTNAEYTSGFNSYNSEWIFGTCDISEENNWYWTFGTQFACNGEYAKKTKYGAGDIEKELTDKMPTNDVRMKNFLTIDKFNGLDLYNGTGTEEQQDGSVKDNIPHINKTYGFMNSDEAFAAAKAYVSAHTPSGVSEAYQSGYYYINAQLKFYCLDSPGVMPLSLIRSSEMVLIEAEANYFLGNTSAAQASLIELNKTSGRNPEYTCTKTGDDLFNEIKDYRELELWGEGFNWYDMKRWKLDIVRKSFADGGNCHVATAQRVSATANDWTWAIPETETNYNDQVK